MFKKIIALTLSVIIILTLSLITLKQINNQKRVAGVNTNFEKQKIKGVIIPHHDLAKQYIEESLNRISQIQNPLNIVVIGPNHFQEGETRFISTDQLFNYPILKEFVYKLQNESLVALSKETVESEHSITVPILYLHNYFPNANFIPLIAPRYFDRSDISQIATFLKTSLPEDTLYVASVDFSHNKMLLEAMNKNKESESAIANFNYEKIYKFQDDYTDSPATLGLLLQIMQRLGATKWEKWYESHGALIAEKLDLQGTSYIIGIFKKDQ